MTTTVVEIDATRVIASLGAMELLLSAESMATFLGVEVGPYLQKRASERFRNEGDDVVGKWATLKPATVAIREGGNWGVGGDHPINRRTGEMEEWITQGQLNPTPSVEGASLQFPSKPPSGGLADKVQTAQGGAVEPPTVARPILGVNEQDMIFVVSRLAFMFQKVGVL